MSDNNKLLTGRLSGATDDFVASFTASIAFDQRLYKHDIAGSIAHANMLGSVGVLEPQERERIVSGLTAILKEIESGGFSWSVALEDVHMNIEHRLIELIGDTGKKLHTGRSRNDQIATDLRLYLRAAIDDMDLQMNALLEALLNLAEVHTDTIMPGFTHLQAAQPVVFGHHLMAWYEMLRRDQERLQDCRRRLNFLPLGAAALAGTTFPIDRAAVAKALDFDGICENSLDAVSDRDFVIEFCSVGAITMMHFSRWCEELVLWSSPQFNFVSLPDRFCTGSSIMPQKKNPDVAELVRGKTGRLYGHLITLLTLMKAQPLTYNKDNQEDKEPVFDAVDTLSGCLTALTGVMSNLEANKSAMRAAASVGFSTATDLADYLVRKNLPFRDAHEAVGAAVAFAIDTNKGLEELSLNEFQKFSALIEQDVYDVLTLEGSVASRSHAGGTAPKTVRRAILAARNRS